MDKPRNPSRLMNSLAVFAFLILFPQVCEVRRLASPQDSGIELEYESSATKVLSEKYEHLLYLTSRDSLIKINLRQFSKFVAEVPRNYSMILLLIDEKTRHSSEDCQIARSSLNVIADSYRSMNLSYPKMFFAEIYGHNSPELFSQIGVDLTDVPSLFYFPSKGMLTNLVELDRSAYSLQIHGITEWIFDQTGVQIEIRRPAFDDPQQRQNMSTSMVTLVLIGLYLFYRRDVLVYIFSLICQEPGALGIMIVSCILLLISGLMYCHIESVAMFHRSPQSGEIFLIYPSTESQFQVELVFVYTLYGMIAYGMVQLIEYPKTMKLKTKSQESQDQPSAYFALSSFTVPFVLVLMLARYKMSGD